MYLPLKLIVFIFQGLEDSWSHKNTTEAQWCVSLANYLRRMKYEPDEITILTTYTGQASLIKEVIYHCLYFSLVNKII